MPGPRVLSLLALGCVLQAAWSVAAPAGAQASERDTQAVFLREVRVDALLESFGLDTADMREAIEATLREAHRLSPATGDSTPALDVSVSVVRSVTGVPPEPRAMIRLEVGRNLMEQGRTARLLWERTPQLSTYVTWRFLVDAARTAVLAAVREFADGRA